MSAGRIALALWDWLSLGRQGTNYEVLESIQPVVVVPSVQAPIIVQPYSSTTALVAGTVNIPLPQPSPDAHRLWLHLFFNRTVAAGDVTQLTRGITAGLFSLVGEYDDAAGNLVTNTFYPLIGQGYYRSPNVEFTPFLPKLMATPQSPANVRATAAAALGNINLAGSFIDLPLSAPFDLNWL